jgi:hypothetical protein
VRFNKPGDPAKFGGLTIVRDDGSSEYQRSPRSPSFILHDLAHYAVESVLGLRDSFFSLVARGHPLGQIIQTADLWLPGLPLEARQTEFLVAALQSEFMGYGQVAAVDAATLNEQVAEGCRRKGLAPPRHVTDDELARMRALLQILLERWHAVAPGAALELRFPCPAGSINEPRPA